MALAGALNRPFGDGVRDRLLSIARTHGIGADVPSSIGKIGALKPKKPHQTELKGRQRKELAVFCRAP